MPQQEIKIVFTGPLGVGKTTAIKTISALTPVSTEAIATDEETKNLKEFTTVGLDYGQVDVDDDYVLRLYGTPGQERFSFMWHVLAKGALGYVILIDHSREEAASDLKLYVDNFAPHAKDSAMVIGVTRSDTSSNLDEYHRILAERNISPPIMSADIRKREDVLMLLDSLFTALETA